MKSLKEMDPLIYKRPVPHNQRPQTKISPRISPYVTEVRSVRPQVAVIARPPVQHVSLDMELPGEESPSRLQTFFRQTKWWKVRRLAFRGIAVGLVLMITLGGLLFSQGYLQAHKVFNGSAGTAAALKTDVDPNLLKGEGRGRVNILLLGRGGGSHKAPDLTDTLMVASIDPVNNTATLVSLPRDLWVKVEDQGAMKLNAVWQTGVFDSLGKTTNGTTDSKAIRAGFDLVDQTVEETLGLEIDYNVLVDFKAFQQAIDTVGGVAINVPADLIDPTMAWENGRNPVLARAGTQSFDGKRALMYVRSRNTSSDFARSERQRAMIVGLKSKVVSLGTLSNPMKISRLLDAFGDNVQTDLSLKNASRLYTIVKSINDANVTSLGLAEGTEQHVTTGNINGQSVVVPTAGLYQYDDIHHFIRGRLQDPYIMREKAKILVLNGSTVPGAAAAKADELKSYGYNVVGVGNAPEKGWIQTGLIDLSHGKNKYTRNYLEQRLGVKATSKLQDATISTNGANFVIIVGSDKANSTDY